MIWLVNLYPRAWRERYGEEFREILASQQPSLGLIADVVAGAVDARLRPQSLTRAKTTAKGTTMALPQWMKQCASGGPQLSKRDQSIAAAVMIGTAILQSIAYLLLTHAFGKTPAVEAVGYSSFSTMMLVYIHYAYWRKWPTATQFATLAGGLILLYVFFWVVCSVAAVL